MDATNNKKHKRQKHGRPAGDALGPRECVTSRVECADMTGHAGSVILPFVVCGLLALVVLLLVAGSVCWLVDFMGSVCRYHHDGTSSV